MPVNSAEGGVERRGTGSDQWAPADYSDGRQPLEWQTKYPPEAQTRIRWEAVYVVAMFVIYTGALFVLLYLAEGGTLPFLSARVGRGLSNGFAVSSAFVGYVCAWVGGGLGGCLFGIKWMYHSVAKLTWHEDRRLWRILTPHISGAVSVSMLLFVSSGLLQIFDKGLAERHTEVLAFGFLAGYFSDRALAKMAEIADTLFGATGRHDARASGGGQ